MAWLEAALFGLALVAFTLGVSSLIMGFIHQPVEAINQTKERIEYTFFGVAGLIICVVLSYGVASV